jgi:hypothetical protein
VRHEHGRRAPLGQDSPQVVAQRLAQRGVEGRERLVEQEQRRIGRQRPPERDTLALAA